MELSYPKKGKSILKDSIKVKSYRSTKKPFTVEARLPGFQEIIKIRAHPNDWKMIFYMGLSDPERLCRYILLNYAEIAYERLYEKRKMSRSKKLIKKYMRNSYRYVAAIYVISTYYLKRPSDEWPNFFQNLISIHDRDKTSKPHTGRLNAQEIAYQCWLNNCEPIRKKLFDKNGQTKGPSKKKTVEDFKETYIDNNQANIKVAKMLFEGHKYSINEKELFRLLRLQP